MRITWNGTAVNHSTLVFYDEITATSYSLRDPVRDIRDTPGALNCRHVRGGNQHWYFADGTLTDESIPPHQLVTYRTRERAHPAYARIQRRSTSQLYPKIKNHNGLWSCRWGQAGELFASAFVGVYERQDVRRKLDGGLGTGNHTDLAIM